MNDAKQPADDLESPDMPGSPDVTEELLGRCLEHSESEWDDAVDRVCEEFPEHADSLRRRFALLRDMGMAAGSEPSNTASDLALVEEFCRDEPDVAAVLADALGVREGIEGLVPRDATTDRIGQTISDRYVLTGRIGAGSMGVVFRADDKELGREVALKFLDAKLFMSGDAEARFLRESESLAALAHPHVVTVFDRGRADNGELYLVMELLQGVSLRSILAIREEHHEVDLDEVRKRIGCDQLPEDSYLRLVMRWASELAEGLGAAHEQGVFHRDVKPSNVFIDRTGRALLLDFGIAARSGDPELTAEQSILGTPWYMAPEQAAGGSPPGPGLDVYALSATLYHLLTGRPPFHGDALEVFARLAIEDPPALRALCPELPRDVAAIVEKGTEKEPSRRYATMSDFRGDLQAFLDHRPVSARPLTRVGRFARRVRRRPARALAAAGAALAAVLIPTTLLLWSEQEARAMESAKADKMRLLPSLLAIEGDPSQRLLVPLDERRDYIRVLDEILAIDDADVPTRLWRAALRLDQGEHDGAADDLRAVAAVAGSAYVDAVAACYAAATAERRGTQAVDLAGIDAKPQSAQEHFIAGFHELRNRHVEGFNARALAHLTAAMDDYLPARDLRLIALAGHADSQRKKTARWDAFQELYDEAVGLEAIYGHETARTCAMRGLALAGQKNYRQAVKPLVRSLELRPDRHGPLLNLGACYRRLLEPRKALEYVGRACELRPHLANSQFTHAQILRDLGDFAGARRIAEPLPESGWFHAAWRKAHLLADITVQELCVAFAPGETEQSTVDALADRALRELETALPLAPGAKYRRGVEHNAVLVRALRQSDFNKAVKTMLDGLRSKPANAIQIGNLTTLLPRAGGLDQETTDALRAYFIELAHTLDPGNPLLEIYSRHRKQK